MFRIQNEQGVTEDWVPAVGAVRDHEKPFRPRRRPDNNDHHIYRSYIYIYIHIHCEYPLGAHWSPEEGVGGFLDQVSVQSRASDTVSQSLGKLAHLKDPKMVFWCYVSPSWYRGGLVYDSEVVLVAWVVYDP